MDASCVCVSACAYVLALVGVHLHTCVCGFMRVSQRTNLDVCLCLLTFKDRVSLLFFFRLSMPKVSAWPSSFRRLSCLCLVFSGRSAGVTDLGAVCLAFL